MNEDNTKVAFNEWLTQSKDSKVKTRSLTASEYIGRLTRLSQRLYGKEDFQSLQNNIYILHLLFMDSSHWINIETDDLDKACKFLQELIKDNLYTSSKNIQVLEQKSKLLEKLKLKIIFKDKS